MRNKTYDFEIDSVPLEVGGNTLCGKRGRKHKMKKYDAIVSKCIYVGCDAHICFAALNHKDG